jgi:hypothetical protein
MRRDWKKIGNRAIARLHDRGNAVKQLRSADGAAGGSAHLRRRCGTIQEIDYSELKHLQPRGGSRSQIDS